MDSEKALERISEIRDEMLTFAVEQAGSRVNKLFVQGKVTDVVQGRITGAQGNLRNVVVANRVLEVPRSSMTAGSRRTSSS